VLYIFADRVQRIKLKIIFYGKANGKILQEESHLYDP
jgi:hypothetical protein